VASLLPQGPDPYAAAVLWACLLVQDLVNMSPKLRKGQKQEPSFPCLGLLAFDDVT
jgi:hypothetical protein